MVRSHSLALAGVLIALVAACSEPATNQGFTWDTGIFPSTDTGGGGGNDVQTGSETAGGTDTTVDPDTTGTTDAGGDDTGGEADTGTVEPTGPVCAKASACKDFPETPYCDLLTKTCVQCQVDFHCKDTTGHCENGKCIDISCVPGSSTCKGNALEVCKADGKGYELKSCPESAPVCYGAKCRFCEPSKQYCAAPSPGVLDSTVAMKCNESGSDADILAICATGEVCSEGACVSCVAGEKKCLGNKGVTCRLDGTGFDITSDCDASGLTCLAGLCVNPCASDLKSNTNVGCDYYAVDLDNALVPAAGGKVYDAQNSQFSVIVSNTKESDALVTVTTGDGKAAKYKVLPNALKIINLPDPLWKISPLNQDGTSLNAKAYRIQSSVPIVAYQFNPLQNFDVFSNDASLLLPSNAVGKEYWVMTRQQTHAALRGYLTIVAVTNGDTTVDVLVTAKTLAGSGALQPIPAGPWTGLKKFFLKKGEVLNIETDQNGADLTGSYIKADKPIAVFGGSEASNAPDTNKCVKAPGAAKGTCQYQGWDCVGNEDCPVTCCADHLEEQLFPVSAWGKTYIASKLKPRGKEKDVWRVLASTDGTVVQTNPPQAPIPTLNQGQWFEFESDQDFVIVANKPIQVGQFMASSHAPNPNNDMCTTTYGQQKLCTTMNSQFKAKIACQKHADCPNVQEETDAKIGDPAFMLTLASDQFLDDYVFLVPNKYTENYVNVVAPMDVGALTLDGQPVPASAFAQIPGVPWRVARLPISQGAHRLKAGKPVALYVYGWADYVSYAYPGGAKVGSE